MKIVIISNNDWDGLWYQRQQFAKMYAEHGHQVLFINKTLQRFPKMKDFKDRLINRKNNTQIRENDIPKGVKTKTIYTLPPLSKFRFINSLIIKNTIDADYVNCDLLITYIPTYTAIDIINVLKPLKTAYINVHNYDADDVVADLLKAENEICSKVDFLFADSQYNMERLVRISKGRNVYDSEPGVDSKKFCLAYRGDEINTKKTIGYFGGIGYHMDFEFYNELSNNYNIKFIGKYNDDKVSKLVSSNIDVFPPVVNEELPNALRDIDILAILYRPTDYVNGVIPAKIYECIATLKPIIVSGLGNMDRLKEVVYTCNGEVGDFNYIVDEKIKENDTRMQKCKSIASACDWEAKFRKLNDKLNVYV